MLNDGILQEVIVELFKNKQTPQGISYILAVLDLDRSFAEDIVIQLDNTGITRSHEGKIMLTSMGLQVAEAGGWFEYLKNPEAFVNIEETEEENPPKKASPWDIFKRKKKASTGTFSFFF